MEQSKQKDKKAGLAWDQRGRPVEAEADKDVKEGGVEQTGRKPRARK